MNITLVSFGNKPWEKALTRLNSQAENVKIFSNIYLLDEKKINIETNFIKENFNFIKEHPKGYGAYTWKPYILLSAFKKFSNSDIFIYMDSGSEFNINQKSLKRLNDYIQIAYNNNIFVMQGRDNEKNLSHCSVIDRIYPPAKNTNQFEAGIIMFRNNDFSLDFINQWKNECIKDNYFNVNPPNKYKCCDNFNVLHLHDQSVLSCLLKKYNIDGISDESSWYLDSSSVSSDMRYNIDMYPIFTARNPFENSIIGKCIQYQEFVRCKHFKDGKGCKELVVVR